MAESGNTYFQELTSREKVSKLNQLTRSGASLTVWEKGSKSRESFLAQEYKESDDRVLCAATTSSELAGKQVLYSFEINGLFFFGSGEFKNVRGGLYALETEEKLFKSERRGTFRLLTFPHHKVFLHVELDEEELQEGNVVGIKSGQSETGLFKNFLSLIKGEADVDPAKEGFVPFRVIDISVTGAAIQVGELESRFFPKAGKTGKLFLEFNGQEEELNEGEIVYNVDMLPANGQRTFKVGIKFLNVDTNMDQKLGKLINGALKDFETEFEDFIK